MIPRIRWRRAATAAALCLSAALAPAVAPASAAPPPVPHDAPEAPSASVAKEELAGLTVELPHSMAGYSRAKFPHWVKQMGTCDTREVVLSRDGQDVKTDDQCRSVSGRWHSAYDGKDFTVASQLDIDHVVPLANAWRSGADSWSTDQRKRFANDLTNPQLVAVSAASNRAKGDQSPDQWRPPLGAYWCAYSRAWTHVKHVYKLSVTQSEQDTLAAMLDSCDR